MVWRCIGSRMTAALSGYGCGKQDMRPYFDAAPSNFEDTRTLESRSMEEEAKLHKYTFNIQESRRWPVPWSATSSARVREPRCRSSSHPM